MEVCCVEIKLADCQSADSPVTGCRAEKLDNVDIARYVE